MNLADPICLPHIAHGPAFPMRKVASTNDWSEVEALLKTAEVPVQVLRGSDRAAPTLVRRRRSAVTFIASPAVVSLVFAATLTFAFWSPSVDCRSRFGCARSTPPAATLNGQVATLSNLGKFAEANMAPVVEGRSLSENRVEVRTVDASAAIVGGPPYGSPHAAGLKAVQDLDLRLRRLQAANDREAADIELLKQRLTALASRLH